jgi:hypothetical protein
VCMCVRVYGSVPLCASARQDVWRQRGSGEAEREAERSSRCVVTDFRGGDSTRPKCDDDDDDADAAIGRGMRGFYHPRRRRSIPRTCLRPIAVASFRRDVEDQNRKSPMVNCCTTMQRQNSGRWTKNEDDASAATLAAMVF